MASDFINTESYYHYMCTIHGLEYVPKEEREAREKAAQAKAAKKQTDNK